MRRGAAPLLRHHQVLASRNLDEAQAYLHSKEMYLEALSH